MSRLSEVFERVRIWKESSLLPSILTRAVAIALGLVLLAWIGSSPKAAPVSVTADATSLSTTTLTSAGVTPDASAPSTLPSAAPKAPHSSNRATPEDPVFINQASEEELRRLPGVGPKRAEAILALRRRLGRFQRIEELLRVKGVGRTTLRKWRPLCRLDAEAPTAAPRDGGG